MPGKHAIRRIVASRALQRNAGRTGDAIRLIASVRLRIKDQASGALQLRRTTVDASHKQIAAVGNFHVHKRIVLGTREAIGVGCPDAALRRLIKVSARRQANVADRSCVGAQEVGTAIGYVAYKVAKRSTRADARWWWHRRLGDGKSGQQAVYC